MEPGDRKLRAVEPLDGELLAVEPLDGELAAVELEGRGQKAAKNPGHIFRHTNFEQPSEFDPTNDLLV